MNTTEVILAIVLLSGGISQAGDYFIYRDSTGRVWLSNQDPRKKDESVVKRPDGVTIIKQYQLPDLADGQVAGSTVVALPPV